MNRIKCFIGITMLIATSQVLGVPDDFSIENKWFGDIFIKLGQDGVETDWMRVSSDSTRPVAIDIGKVTTVSIKRKVPYDVVQGEEPKRDYCPICDIKPGHKKYEEEAVVYTGKFPGEKTIHLVYRDPSRKGEPEVLPQTIKKPPAARKGFFERFGVGKVKEAPPKENVTQQDINEAESGAKLEGSEKMRRPAPPTPAPRSKRGWIKGMVLGE